MLPGRPRTAAIEAKHLRFPLRRAVTSGSADDSFSDIFVHSDSATGPGRKAAPAPSLALWSGHDKVAPSTEAGMGSTNGPDH